MSEITRNRKKAFISYSSRDSAFATQLAGDLLRSGIDIWIDVIEIKAGDSLVEKIFNEGIGKVDYLLIVLSKISVESRWVKRELNVSFVRELNSANTFIIPLIIEDCDIPTSISDKKYADFRNSYHLGLKEVLKAIPVSMSETYRSPYVTTKPHIPNSREEAKLAYARASKLYEDDDLPGAIDMYNLATRLDPTLIDAHYNIAVAMFDLAMRNAGSANFVEMMREVIAKYEFILKFNEDDVDSLVNLVAAYESAKQLENPIREYELLERTIKIAPNYALAHYNLGNFFAKYWPRTDVRDKLKLFESNKETEATLNFSYLGLALKYYEEASKLDPGFADLCNTGSEKVKAWMNILSPSSREPRRGRKQRKKKNRT